MTTSPDWLRRYRDGYRDQVWQELRQLGGAVREQVLAEEAQLVCDEMARRARRNVELIIGRLTVQVPTTTPRLLSRPTSRPPRVRQRWRAGCRNASALCP